MAGINGFGNYGNYGNYGKYNYNGNNAWDKKQAGLNSGLEFNSNQGDGFVKSSTGNNKANGEEPIETGSPTGHLYDVGERGFKWYHVAINAVFRIFTPPGFPDVFGEGEGYGDPRKLVNEEKYYA